MANPNWVPWIQTYAAQYGVDPRAALAVARQEGLSGGVGDGGHAFGPFQMNDAGGVLTNRPGNHRAYAESRAGIADAIAQMARGGARGKTGAAAVRAIVNGFERPLNPSKEIAGALAAYGARSPAGVASGSPLASYATPNAPGSGNGRRNALLASIFQRDQAYTGIDSTAGFRQYMAGAPVQMQTPRGNAPVTGQQLAGTQHDPHGIVAMAEKWLGTPYSWGGGGRGGPSKGIAQGANTVGFDCSSFVQYLWGKQGVSIPRTTYQQWHAGTAVNPSSLKPGDAVFFDMGSQGPGHVGMYIGGGKYIESPHTGGHIQISNLKGASGFVGARRF